MSAIEIAAEIEEMDFQPLDLTGHCRAATQIGHAAMPLGRGAKIDPGFDGIDAEGRAQIVAEADIRGRKSELPAPLISVLDPPLDLPCASEQGRRPSRFAGLERLANRRR